MNSFWLGEKISSKNLEVTLRWKWGGGEGGHEHPPVSRNNKACFCLLLQFTSKAREFKMI